MQKSEFLVNFLPISTVLAAMTCQPNFVQWKTLTQRSFWSKKLQALGVFTVTFKGTIPQPRKSFLIGSDGQN